MNYSAMFNAVEAFKTYEANCMERARVNFQRSILNAYGETTYFTKGGKNVVMVRDLRVIANKKGN